MAQSSRKRSSAKSGASRTKKKKTRSASTRARGNGAANGDAIALLKADHREVEGWFEDFEKARSDDRKQELAKKICTALKVHAGIEEEIFYPAFLEATEDKDIHHEAAVEHDGAKHLIEQIESAGPEDDYFEAKVSVLAEMVKHHVKEEEKRSGMFGKARESDMDLQALGEQLQARKDELMREMSQPSSRAKAPARAGAGRAGASLASRANSKAGRESARRARA